MRFSFYRQQNIMDCGPACLKMICKFYNKSVEIGYISKLANFSKEGVTLLGISDAAEALGFQTLGVQLTFEQLIDQLDKPCIIHWNQNHFVVVLPIFWRNSKRIKIADPAIGIRTLRKADFLKNWESLSDENGLKFGTALILSPSSNFTTVEIENDEKKRYSWSNLVPSFRKAKWNIFYVFFSLLLITGIQSIIPFITQAIVDTGISSQNLQFVTILLIAQATLIFSKTIIELIRSRILLRISVQINHFILSDFWVKLIGLPLSYFSQYQSRDVLQRLSDAKKIESFVTNSVISTIFSIFNLLIFSIILLFYNDSIFYIFLVASIFYFLWIRFFFRYRKKINYENFSNSAELSNKTVQIIQGISDLKLFNAEKEKRWEWERTQIRLFQINFRSLTISQIQQTGAIIINESKNIIITFLVAKMVVENNLTFGAMISIQYILGQMNQPLEQLISFSQAAQDSKISFDRMSELFERDAEENDVNNTPADFSTHKSISFSNVSFSYSEAVKDATLRNISFEVKGGQTIAIVGPSGSGKTTIFKLLLRYYEEYSGLINVGDTNLKQISPKSWRNECGAVMQDGYIFSDTIIKNIALGDSNPNLNRIEQICKDVNLHDFILTLTKRYNTRLGYDGVGLSQGQKQRLLIARVLYKNPKIILFDEATNALDSKNEKLVLDNLKSFFMGKIIIIIAHRLSTIKNADQIIVLSEGEIVEKGAHDELYNLGGKYFELIQSQIQ